MLPFQLSVGVQTDHKWNHAIRNKINTNSRKETPEENIPEPFTFFVRPC